ncbi:MAG: ABC transporter substrate-binding protein [Chloroflexota bacterium]
MGRVGNILKTIGKVLLGILLVLILIAGAFFIWLRSDGPEVTECDTEFRLYEHSFGVTCIPENPERVLAYGTSASQFYAAIERPMAMLVTDLDEFTAADIPGLYDHIREVNDGVIDLGRLGGGLGPNMEILLQIDPDLIVSEWPVSDDIAKTASLVAPVVFVTELGGWEDVMLTAGDVIAEKEQAEFLLESYHERVQILQDQFDDPSEITIANVRLFNDLPRVQMPVTFSGQVIQDVGFSFPEAQMELVEDDPDVFQIDFNKERIDLIDADYIFIYAGSVDALLAELGADGPTLVANFVDDPLFQFLDAAQSGNVYETDIYWAVTGINTAHYVLDDLFRIVAGVDPEEVAPNPLLLE